MVRKKKTEAFPQALQTQMHAALKEIFEASGVSSAQFGRDHSVAPPNMSKYLRNRIPVTAKLLQAIAEKQGYTVSAELKLSKK